MVFGKLVGVCALAIGVSLALLTIERGKPDLSSLFALQSVTPIHVAPSLWLGLHWRRLRGEAVLAGFVCGLSVTLGMVFSDYNVRRAVGSDLTKSGLSGAWIGFCINIGLTIVLGLAMQFFPQLFGFHPQDESIYETQEEEFEAELPGIAAKASGLADSGSDDDGAKAPAIAAAAPAPEEEEQQEVDPKKAARAEARAAKQRAQDADDEAEGVAPLHFRPRPLDIGPKRDAILNPSLWFFMFLVLLFTVPFVRVPLSRDGYIGAMGTWAFTALLLSGVLAIAGSTMFIFLWENYKVWPYARGGTARTPLELVVSPPAAATAAAAPAADAAAPVPAVSAADAPDGAGGKL